MGSLGKAADMGEESAPGDLSRPHIVMFNFPVQGRMIPAMMLASRLAALGAEVSYVCPDYQLKKLGEAKARGYSDRIRLVGLATPNSEGLIPLDGSRDALQRLFDDLGLLTELFEEFIGSLAELPACVISDEVCAGIADVAQRFKLPRYIFCPQSAFAFSAAMFVRRLAADARFPLPNTPHELVQIPGTPPLLACEFLSPYTDKAPGWFTDFFVAAALRAHDADGVLINTFDELEPGSLSALRSESELNPNKLRIVPIGPLLPEQNAVHGKAPSASRPEEGLCLEFLNKHPPASVVYISFGTLKKLNEHEVCEIAHGLEAAGRPFIWMLRSEAGVIPDGFQPTFGLVLSTWAPQLQILSHPSTAAFVTHFGWNSTLESLSCGVPMLGLPSFMDQFMNRMLVVEILKVGLSLPDVLERAEVEKGMTEVLGSEAMRHRARGLREAAGRAMGIANHSLTNFIDGLRHPKQDQSVDHTL